MKKRVESIDALRGITIFLMILCSSIGSNSGLPAWMFHCQVPPPDYVFKPEVRGITWVDLVFPFFIFSMGAAFPLALRKRFDRGEGLVSIILGVVKRWVVLVAFALVIGNADAAYASPAPAGVVTLWRLGVWLALFAALVKSRRKWVNIAGWLVLAGLMAVGQWALKVPLSQHNNDIIILLLSTVALLGSLIWIFTRDSIRLRSLVWLLVIATKLIGWDFAMYLVIAIPASIAGDVLMKSDRQHIADRRDAGAAFIALFAVLVQLWGLYTRNVFIDFALSFAAAAAFVLLTLKVRNAFSQIGWMGFAMLLAGIIFDRIDGGIAKDYCNMSYLLTTGGQTALTLCFLLWNESRRQLSRTVVMTGQNPMIAYTVAWFVLCPFFSAIGLMEWVDGICAGSPVLGLCRGLFVTAATVAVTCVFTKLKLFWRS